MSEKEKPPEERLSEGIKFTSEIEDSKAVRQLAGFLGGR
jgi:hypothetical protein